MSAEKQQRIIEEARTRRENIMRLYAGGMKVTKIAKRYQIGRSRVYQILKAAQ